MWSSVGVSARPLLRLGGASPGALMLPDASPTPGTMYAPRGVWTDGERIVACDTGNHRVLIWHSFPKQDGAPADVVLGQPDFYSEGPNVAGTDTVRGVNLPTGVGVVDGRLVVADAWNHRLLAWDDLPETSFAAPTYCLGQANEASVEANRGGDATLSTFYWPFGFGVVADTFWVADTGNRRVLGWHGGHLPDPSRPADILLGQDEGSERSDNRGGEAGGTTFRWPHAVTGDDATLYVADAGDHRVLGWSPPPVGGEVPATVVLGQQDTTLTDEFKSRPQGAQRMRFPYAVATDATRLFVADTSNNRILVWHGWPRVGAAIPAFVAGGAHDPPAQSRPSWKSLRFGDRGGNTATCAVASPSVPSSAARWTV